MCSYGGHIVPRPHDDVQLRWPHRIYGFYRIVVVDRHTTLPELTHRLTKTLLRSSSSSMSPDFTVKYQLPSEDLDSLISVTTDEDLENMIDEHERLNINKSHRLQLFLFLTKPEGRTYPRHAQEAAWLCIRAQDADVAHPVEEAAGVEAAGAAARHAARAGSGAAAGADA
ncbi:hypothetical protein R6Q57_011641 [Mikania cordata]